MTRNGLPAIILTLGLAACSGDDTPTAGTGGGGVTDPGSGGGSGGATAPTEPTGPTSPELRAAVSQRDEAQRAVAQAVEQLRTAQTAEERASATLRRDAARADVAALTARVNMERARLEVAAAEAAARAASTDAERGSARERLQAAEARLAPIVQEATQALRAAQAALSAEGADAATPAARSAAQEVRARATGILARVQAFQVSVRSQIATARRLVPETPAPGSGAGAAGAAGVATIMRHARAASDGTALAQSARLAIATDAVPYSTGKRVIASDRSGSDELPLRDLTLRIGTTTAANVKIQGRDGSATTYTETDGAPVSSINLGSDRFVYKFGGAGVTFHDTQRRFDIGSTKDAWRSLGADRQTGTTDDDYCDDDQSNLARCSAWNSDDLEITWQAGLSGSYNSPNGEPVHYRSSRVPFPEGQSPSQPNLLPTFQNDREDWDLGFYELWVTNHGGYDRKLEPANAQGQRYPADDEDRYLKFAAYGLFVHTDTLTDYLLPSRVQAFHFGYDAFEDKANKRTTDISAPINVTFNGRTMGFMYQHFSNSNPARVDFRGDVVLSARIGSGANTISGQVTSLEKLSARGRWVRFERAANIRTGNVGDRLVFASDSFGASGQDFAASGAPISADGSYKGGVYLQQWDSGTSAWVEKTSHFKSSSSTSLSEFGGTLYGSTGNDLDDLETAGYWYLEGDSQQQRWGGMVGSFGAVGTAQTN